ncbi:MAG: AMP-binding protein, partial [Alphaproteobacteria bacterium]
MTKDSVAAEAAHPWLNNYPPEIDWATPVARGNLVALLEGAVDRHGARPCVDFLGKTYSYAEIGDLVARAARGFQSLGVTKGTRVGLCLPNTPYAVICYFAILRAGGTVVNYNPLYAPRELVHQIEDSGTHIIVTIDIAEVFDKVHDLLRESGLGRIVVCPMTGILPTVKRALFSLFKRGDIARVPADEQHIPFAQLIDNDGAPEPVAIDPAEDIAVLQYTGGTTGVPKGAMLTHANLTANTDQVRGWFIGMRPGEESLLG